MIGLNFIFQKIQSVYCDLASSRCWLKQQSLKISMKEFTSEYLPVKAAFNGT